VPGSLSKKLVTEFEQLQQAHPYVPYGASVRKQAEELLKKSKRGQRPERGQWNPADTFTQDEIRLILADPEFGKQMLKAYDPRFKTRNPTNLDANVFRQKLADLYRGQMSEQDVRASLQQAPRIKEEALNKIEEQDQAGRKAETMLGQASRLAPLSSLHTTAKELLQRNNPGESLRLGREEIAAAGRTDVPREIAPYLAKASETPAAFLKEYEMNYTPIIENFRREAAKDFLERDLPSINNQFASRGAFYSGAREHAINKARADKEQRIEHEIARLLTHGREEGMKHYHQERQGHLKQAEVAGHAHGAQQESRLRGAEALRVNSGMEQAALHQQASGLEQLGRTEQQQAQNELNVRQQEHAQEMERPFIQQMRKAAIASGAPHPHPQLSPESMNPPPPSVYGLGSGLIGQMAGLVGQQQTQAHARGGHVRQKFAAGDSVNRAASQLQELRKHVEATPEEAEMRESAQHFKNHRANPMADYLFAAGSHQLANLGGSPMKAYGEGAQLGMDAYKRAQGTNLSAQDKYYNLMNKINQTKMDQHQFLAQYHSVIQQQEEAARHHRNQESETRRAHNMSHSLNSSMLSTLAQPRNPHLPHFSSKEEEKSFWKEQEAAKKEFRLNRKAIDKDINNFRHFKGLIDKGIGNTGPGVGLLPNAIATWLDKPEIAANRFLAQKALNEKVLELSGAMKGAQSDKDMAILQGTVPSMSDTPLTFKKYIDKWEKLSTRAEDEKKFIDKKVKEGFPITQAQEEWHEYVNANPLFTEEDMSETTEPFEEVSGKVPVVGPDGQIWMIPQANVSEALANGGQLAGR